jgi:hypothetical protein
VFGAAWLISAGAAYGTTIVNPSFEAADSAMRPTGWTYVASGTPAAQGAVSTEWVTHGNRAFKIWSPTANTWGTNVGVEQFVDLTSVLSIEFDARIAVSPGNGTYLDLLIDDFTAYWSRNGVGIWLNQTVDLSNLTGVHKITFRYVWGSPVYTGPATSYVDNVRVHDDVPVSAQPLTWTSLKSLYGR